MQLLVGNFFIVAILGDFFFPCGVCVCVLCSFPDCCYFKKNN